MRLLILLLSFLLQVTSCAQRDSSGIEPVVNNLKQQLGNRNIDVNLSWYQAEGSLFFIQLHDNEETAETVAIDYLKENGGSLLSIENGGERNISFSISGKRYEFDPNRIFTSKGIKETLTLFGSYNSQAEAAIERFAAALLTQLPDSVTIIALHNNTDKRYSIASFKTDKDLKSSVRAMYHNTSMDEDDFFITTDPLLYTRLKDENYSVVLQDNFSVPDDGSLSVYLGKMGKSYINIEAEYGHAAQQAAMLHTVVSLLKVKEN